MYLKYLVIKIHFSYSFLYKVYSWRLITKTFSPLITDFVLTVCNNRSSFHQSFTSDFQNLAVYGHIGSLTHLLYHRNKIQRMQPSISACPGTMGRDLPLPETLVMTKASWVVTNMLSKIFHVNLYTAPQVSPQPPLCIAQWDLKLRP